MGFGYKTSWLAVRDRAPVEVADALELHNREAVDWETGTGRAYKHGVFAAGPVSGWTFAHSRIHLPVGFDASMPQFPGWLTELSRRLGEVQFFTSDRVVSQYGWARADGGHLSRAYCFSEGEVALFIGAPTPDEVELNLGTRNSDETSDEWSDGDWEAWFATVPYESEILTMAARWSLDPTTIDEATVPNPGLYGLPPSITVPLDSTRPG
ncbi:hypothetical protein [Actinoplanes sp. NPDC026670]|uniref:hypothetical protein n=1 Tax=Actinoplanes sp. NPDC026670 TaxID=3154700 RepID=UPI0033CAE99B